MSSNAWVILYLSLFVPAASGCKESTSVAVRDADKTHGKVDATDSANTQTKRDTGIILDASVDKRMVTDSLANALADTAVLIGSNLDVPADKGAGGLPDLGTTSDTPSNMDSSTPRPEEGLIAFPGAEGYGKASVGGRGGKVYEVTTLKSTGPGSLGEAISAMGPRTVVFKVAGTIEGSFNIANDKITIAGQTAPGDGVCIKGNLSIRGSDVILRYIRARPNATGDAIGGGGGSRIILDHVSASWSSDEVLSVYGGDNVTFQYCMITEACSSDHKFGGIWGNNNSTYHHNLFAHNASRNPRWASGGSGNNDYRNNVIYNWGYNTCYGGGGKDNINMVANYYKSGPATEATVKDRIAEPNSGSWFIAENVVVGSPDVTADNWKGVSGSNGKKLATPWPAMAIRQEAPEDAYETVLKHAGCSLPNRDAVDSRIITEVQAGTATFGNHGLISKPGDVGGWPELKGGTAYTDSDHDGMPDSWETQNGLNPNDPNDGNKTDSIGYTMLENFLNSIDNL